MFKVTFAFENGSEVEAFANAGDNLLEVARGANVAIDAPCSGNGACGKCRVQLKGGELDSKKTLHISDEEYNAGWRLACMSKITADVEVLVPDIASAYKSRMKVADLSSKEEIAIFEKAKHEVESAGIELTNSLDVIEVHMEEPSLDDTMPDNERLTRALRKYMNLKHIRIPYSVLKKLPDVLRNSKFSVKCVVRTTPNDMFVYDIFDSKEDVVIGGLAVDIGTTTVSAVLINMESGEILAKSSSGNGQIRFGADVINRIIESQKPGGKKKLQDAVIKETINPMIHEMCRSIHFPEQQIYRMCVASNTTMNHLFAGINADPLRMEPYIPAFFKTNSLFASDVGIEINPDAHIIMAPNIGSYVGGDITAGTLVSQIWNRPEFSLFIDLGTNGELVFGNSDFMMSCACSAGPAFEGGDISCGMRATDGAIEACTIDKETMEPTYKIVGDPGTKPVGLCGSGIIDVISELYICGIINPKGKFIREGKRIKHDKYGMGSYILAFEEEAGSVKDVEITEVDIDNLKSSLITSMIPEPQSPTGLVPGSPTTLYVGSMVSLSMVHASMAPSVARIPQLMSPPSKAGPAEHAQLIMKSELPNTSSPLVPRSINRENSGLFQIILTSVPAVISPPT